MSNYSDITEFDIQLFVRDISAAICSKFGNSLQEIAENATKTLKPIDLRTFLVSCRSQGNYQRSFKNMFHAWYSECFLSYPSVHSMLKPPTKDIERELNRHIEWMNKHFIGWRYIIGYYSLFFSLSAMLRAIDESYKGGHRNIIKAFNTRFYSRRFPRDFMLFPFDACSNSELKNVFSRQFLSAASPVMEAKEGEKISLLDLLYIGRQRVNYYIISRFARTRKQRYRIFFTLNLRRTVFLFNLIAEVFLIKCFDYYLLQQRFRTAEKHWKKSKILPYPVTIRFGMYEKHLKDTKGILSERWKRRQKKKSEN